MKQQKTSVLNGWKKEGDHWYWYDQGRMLRSEWKQEADGMRYYFRADGAMARNQWVISDHELYWLAEDGRVGMEPRELASNARGALERMAENPGQRWGEGIQVVRWNGTSSKQS